MTIKIPVPDGKQGEFAIETFTVSPDQAKFFNMNKPLSRKIIPGEYKRLVQGNQIIMSNTPAEIRDHLPLFKEAKKKGGHILITGLGLGMCVNELLDYDNVESVTVFEKEQDVIDLVAPSYMDDPRFMVAKRDVLDYFPPLESHFDIVWHDIWPAICEDNYREMLDLMEIYTAHCDWQDCWCREYHEGLVSNIAI